MLYDRNLRRQSAVVNLLTRERGTVGRKVERGSAGTTPVLRNVFMMCFVHICMDNNKYT